jgi:hypothetical protein
MKLKAIMIATIRQRTQVGRRVSAVEGEIGERGMPFMKRSVEEVETTQ